MAENTLIEWCDHTLNPWEGCQKVAPECDNCYAETRNEQFHGGVNWGPKAPRRRTSAQTWNKARKWNQKAETFFEQHGRRQRVFCASLADVFDNAVDLAWRADLWALIRECDQLDWLLLTKRPQNIAKMLPEDWGKGWGHVWLGTSAGTQKTADQNIPPLLDVPAAVRFLSCEPMLGPVDLLVTDKRGHDISALRGLAVDPTDPEGADEYYYTGKIHWVICGGESGPKARPMHPNWARSLRDQCEAAEVPFLFKQWGEYADHTETHGNCQPCLTNSDLLIDASGHIQGGGAKGYGGFVDPDWREKGQAWMCKVGKKVAGRLLDGVEHNGFPTNQKDQGDE